MREQLESILQSAQKEIAVAADMEQVNELRVKYLGKKGSITALSKAMGTLSPQERPVIGELLSKVRGQVEQLISGKLQEFQNQLKQEKMKKETIDVTLNSKKLDMGGLHPLTKVYYEVRDIFVKMGFEVLSGPEVEYDKYNFEMLNIPKNHPARDMQDTFYITEDIVLRTHTSPVQVRTMLSQKPPIRMICPGRTYRTDDVDATHSPIFNQIEGLVIGKDITFAHLKGTINTFLKELYGSDTKTKFRPGYFPFTEPSAEVDATCAMCKGKGCPACKGAGMIEVLGCGMVNPKVLKNCGIDPEEYSGFAFGLGLDRLTNIKYRISDIRYLYENDVRFLSQFR